MDRGAVIAAIVKLSERAITRDERRGLILLLKAYRRSTMSRWARMRTGLILTAGIIAAFALQFELMRVMGFPRFSQQYIPGLMVLLIFAEGWLFFRLISKFTPRAKFDTNGVHLYCASCKYDLSGHDSVLGDELWVGPALCPECGQDYPAISR